jgi:hypothetical protein
MVICILHFIKYLYTAHTVATIIDRINCNDAREEILSETKKQEHIYIDFLPYASPLNNVYLLPPQASHPGNRVVGKKLMTMIDKYYILQCNHEKCCEIFIKYFNLTHVFWSYLREK